jgi:transposase
LDGGSEGADRRQSYAGGESVSAVARRHGLTPQQLFGWRRHGHRPAEECAREDGLAFAPVIVEAAPPCPSAARPSGGSDVSAIEIVIGGTMVRVPPGTDVTTLQVVLRAVKAVS